MLDYNVPLVVMKHNRWMWNLAGGYGTLQVVMEHNRWMWNPAGGYGTLQVDVKPCS